MNLDLKNLDDLVYLEGSHIDNLGDSLSEVSRTYNERFKLNDKFTKSNPSLFIYNFRTPSIDFTKPNWRKEAAKIVLDNPAIQPHDSSLNKLELVENSILISGDGNSYMNYQEYDFKLQFNDISELSVTESFYSKMNKERVEQISFEDLVNDLDNLFFRDIFIEGNFGEKPTINYLFIKDDISNQDEERSIIKLSFAYDCVNTTCELKSKKPKLKV